MNRRERKKELTKDKIIECAIELFKEKGFNETYMEEIAEKTDISKGTLYNYFEDKESILGGYFQSNIAEYREEFTVSFNEHKGVKNQLINIIDFINSLMESNIQLSELYLNHRIKTIFSDKAFDEAHRSGIESLILKVIKEGQDKKELRQDIPVLIMARNFMFLYMNFFTLRTYGNESLEEDYAKSLLVELFLNGAKN